MHNNFIRSIINLEGKDKLSFLDMTHNWLSDWSSVTHIQQNCPALKELGLKCNPLTTKKSYRAQIFSTIECLSKLDGSVLSDKDKERVENESKVLSIETIMDCSKDYRKGMESDVSTHATED